MYDVGDGDDEVVGPSCGDDCLHDAVHVGRLVDVVGALVEQFLNDVGEVFGQRLAHFGACVLARHVAAHGHELVYGDVIPVVDVFLGLLHEFQFLLRVVDERTEFALFIFAQGGAEELVLLAFDNARRVFEHVQEGLIFAVDVGQKVFRALRQIEDGLQVDDFRACVGHGRERLRE